MLKKLIYSLLYVGSITTTYAQDYLTLEEAIKTGLEKNYAVLMAKTEKEITHAQNNSGNAGMSPQVSLNGNLNLANVNSHQEFSTGVIQDRDGAQSNNIGASAVVTWTIFDGLKMFAIKKRLNETELLSELQLKQQMENTIYAIILAYYDIARVNKLITAGKQNLAIYAEKKKIAQLKFTIGSDSKIDLLLTNSDENKAKSDLLQLELQLTTSKVNLNTLLARSPDIDFKTTDSIPLSYDPKLDELKKSISTTNSSVLISKQNELISIQSIKEARSNNLPFVQLNGAYNFIRNQSQAGFIFVNRQLGLNGGLSASWLLFNGTKNKKLIQEKQLNLLQQKYVTEEIQQQLDGTVYVSYSQFLTHKKILDMEQQNVRDANEVLTISIERYKIGKANLLETTETKKNLEDAQTRYINALYNLKKAETELRRTTGGLISKL